MRNIFVEGVRSAFIRIIRMLVYIVIGIIIFYIIGLFTSNKAHAMVYKGEVWNTMNQYAVSGSLNKNSSATLSFNINNSNINSQSVPYDTIVFKFNTFEIGLNQLERGSYCHEWVQGSTSTCQSQNCFTCNYIYSSLSGGDGLLQVGNVYMQATSYWGTNGDTLACYLSDDLKDQIICPIKRTTTTNLTKLEITIQNGGNDSLDYNINLSGLKYYYNYESTEIVNGLTGVQNAQSQTITIIQQQTQEIEQQNQYMQSDNVTSSMTSANNSFTIMTNEITQQLGSANELTQIVVAPVSMFMELATDSCSPLVLNVPFVNVQATIPCMKPVFNQYFAGLYTIFTTAISAIITYWVSVKTFSLIKDILDCDNDRIEVLDL